MQASSHAIPHTGVHEAHHEDVGFWRKYIFSTDHKVIGIQYGVTGLFFLLFGFLLMLMMRWKIANPAEPLPIFGHMLDWLLRDKAGNSPIPGGVMSADLYNSFGAMHGTLMVFDKMK